MSFLFIIIIFFIIIIIIINFIIFIIVIIIYGLWFGSLVNIFRKMITSSLDVNLFNLNTVWVVLLFPTRRQLLCLSHHFY